MCGRADRAEPESRLRDKREPSSTTAAALTAAGGGPLQWPGGSSPGSSNASSTLWAAGSSSSIAVACRFHRWPARLGVAIDTRHDFLKRLVMPIHARVRASDPQGPARPFVAAPRSRARTGARAGESGRAVRPSCPGRVASRAARTVPAELPSGASFNSSLTIPCSPSFIRHDNAG